MILIRPAPAVLSTVVFGLAKVAKLAALLLRLRFPAASTLSTLTSKLLEAVNPVKFTTRPAVLSLAMLLTYQTYLTTPTLSVLAVDAVAVAVVTPILLKTGKPGRLGLCGSGVPKVVKLFTFCGPACPKLSTACTANE